MFYPVHGTRRYMSFRIEGLGFDRFARFDFFGPVIAQEIITPFWLRESDGFLYNIESATERRRPALKRCFLVL